MPSRGANGHAACKIHGDAPTLCRSCVVEGLREFRQANLHAGLSVALGKIAALRDAYQAADSRFVVACLVAADLDQVLQELKKADFQLVGDGDQTMIPADHTPTPDMRTPRTSPAYTGTIRPQDAFEICHERYRHCRLILENKISTINPMASVEYNWRPDRSPKLREYVADFEQAGEEVLSQNPTWGPRLDLFRVYFCQGVPYQQAIRVMGVKTGTFDRWMWEVKRTVGLELLRRRVFPPGRYFREPTLKNRPPATHPRAGGAVVSLPTCTGDSRQGPSLTVA